MVTRRGMGQALGVLLLAALLAPTQAGRLVYPPYGPQKVVLDFYFDHPQKIDTALYWLRTLVTTLTDAPYDYAVDDLSIKVVVHGTELVTLAKKNYDRYRRAVDRMRYYAELGVEFKVCVLAAEAFGYRPEDFQDFVDIVPSAMTELVHWQQRGHALLTPRVPEKLFSIEEIR